MAEFDGTKKSREGVNYYIFIGFCIFIALLLVLYYMFGSTPGSKYTLADSDCYMHLIRASDLYNHGQWYDPVWIKSNAPFGEPLHWSRPFDVLLLAGAVPLSVFVDFETALFWWGVCAKPGTVGFIIDCTQLGNACHPKQGGHLSGDPFLSVPGNGADLFPA